MFEPLHVVTIEKNKRTHEGVLALFPKDGLPVGHVGSVNVRRPNPKAVAYANLFASAPELLETLKESLLLFAKDHALDRMDWGKSALRAEDIQELNELPLKIRTVIAMAEGRLCPNCRLPFDGHKPCGSFAQAIKVAR